MINDFKNEYFEFKLINKNLGHYYMSGKEASDQEIKEFLSLKSQILYSENQEPIAVIYFAENLKSLKIEHRVKIGLWVKENTKIIQEKVIAVGYKLDGFWGKILLSGIFLVQKPIFPYLVENEIEAIDTWIEKKINEYYSN